MSRIDTAALIYFTHRRLGARTGQVRFPRLAQSRDRFSAVSSLGTTTTSRKHCCMTSPALCRHCGVSPPSSRLPHRRLGLPRNRACFETRATTVEAGSWSSVKSDRPKERVLRYPNGQERRIRYPEQAALVDVEVEEDEQVVALESFERLSEWWGVDRYYQASSDDEEDPIRLSSLASTSGRTTPAALPPTGLPSTPGELLRYVNSDAFKAARAEQLQLVRSSYQVLDGSPWLQTKQVYVLAALQPGSETGLTFTFRTRVQQKGAEDQLTKLLGRSREDGSSLIRCEELRDGIITFEDEADAHRFASLMEADGNEVAVAGCDAHALFREAAAVRAVVVLLRECSGLDCHLPMPEDLAAALRGQRSLEDPADL